MAQNLITFEKALKENYLPVWQNQLNIEPSPILAKIKKIPLKSNKVVSAAPVGISGGFGFGAEGAATPAAGHVNFQRFESEAKDMYVDVCISAKAVRLGTTAGAMANALDTEVKGAYAAAKWNVGRSLFGNGTGVLAGISALEAAGNTIAVDSTARVIEGLIVDFFADGATSETQKVHTARIVSVDRDSNTITVDGDAKTYAKGFITVQNSYMREITGLGTIFDDSIETIYGISKAENPYLKPVVVDADGDISDGIITKALRRAGDNKGSAVDIICCGNDAYDQYVEYLRTSNRRIEDASHVLDGGFNAIKFLHKNRVIDVVNEPFVPAGEMWGFDSSALELHAQEWNFADLQGGGIFNLMERSSVYRALLANYGELMCKNPGGCVRIKNCAV